MRKRTLQTELVVRATAEGWTAADANATAIRHFHFLAPVRFHGEQRADILVCWFNNDSPLFTVGNTSTSSHRQAVLLLLDVLRRVTRETKKP